VQQGIIFHSLVFSAVLKLSAPDFSATESLLSSSVSPFDLVRQECWACCSRVKVKSCAYSVISLIILFLTAASSGSAP
jgi:hypothetical protein